MARSQQKGPFVDGHLMEKVQRMAMANQRQPIKTWSRRSTVIPEFVGFTFLVHNGNKFIPVYVTEQMVGHRLGEFSPTRAFVRHAGQAEKIAAAAAPAAATPKAGEKKA